MTLEQRIARLEAIEEIKQLKSRYFHACDTKQPELVRDCFYSGEIDLDYGRVGSFSHRDQLVELFTQLACSEHIVEMHHGQNPQVQIIDECHAQATFGLYYFLIDTRQNTLTQLGGYYRDAFVVEQDKWCIQRSHYTVSSTQILSLEDGVAKAIFAGVSAPQALDDPAKQAL